MNILSKLEETKKIVKAKRKRKEYIQYYIDAYGIIPNKKQFEVIESKDNFIEITFERREGCSTAAMIKAIEYAINNQRSRVVLLNAYLGTSNIRIDEMIRMLSSDALNRHVLRTTKRPNRIQLLNGSIINVVDSKIENFRGASVDCFIIDTPKWFRDDQLMNVVRCCTLHNPNSQIISLNQIESINGQSINM